MFCQKYDCKVFNSINPTRSIFRNLLVQKDANFKYCIIQTHTHTRCHTHTHTCTRTYIHTLSLFYINERFETRVCVCVYVGPTLTVTTRINHICPYTQARSHTYHTHTLVSLFMHTHTCTYIMGESLPHTDTCTNTVLHLN